MNNDLKAKDTGGPAFPFDQLHQGANDVYDQHWGMTLRDYFAAKAMQGYAAGILADGGDWPNREILAANAYATADAMIAERAK